MKRIVWIVPLVFLYVVGCNAVRYTAPTTGSRARVRFVAETEIPTEVYSYKTNNCEGEERWMLLRKGPFLNSPQKRLGIPLYIYHKNAAKEFYVSTEKPLIVMFKNYKSVGYPANTFICDVPVFYQFEEKDYEVSFNWPSYATGCTGEVFEIVETNFGLHKKRLLKTFDNKMSVDNADCMRAFEKRRRRWSDIMFRNLTYK
jgi:hypothetical protein